MLIDLARNDIGRIAKIGSVEVTEAFVVERYSHVMHIVSNVEGILKEGLSNMDVLRATFPAGTLSGAPKVHAMELIDQLEPSKRGIYGGACGYLSFAGDMDVAIAIRTGIIKDGYLRCLSWNGKRLSTRRVPCFARANWSRRDWSEHHESSPAFVDGRQLRLVHLQPGAIFRRAGCSGRGAPQ
jgi:hypothetical protein